MESTYNKWSNQNLLELNQDEYQQCGADRGLQSEKENNAIVVPTKGTLTFSSNFDDIVSNMISDKALFNEFRYELKNRCIVTSVAVQEFLFEFVTKRIRKKPFEKAGNGGRNKQTKKNTMAERVLKTNLYLLRKMKPCLTSVFKKSDFLPKIDFSTLALGCQLGNGTQSVVFEVESFMTDAMLKSDVNTCTNHSLKSSHAPPRLKQGNLSTSKSVRNMKSDKEPLQHYAAKLPRTDDEKYTENVKDLMRESHILSSIEHPNIIKMHGMSKSLEMTSKQDKNESRQPFFLILDRLSYTLEDLLEIWAEKKHNVNIFKFQTFKEESFMQRLQVVYDIASAVNHLHKNKFLHRDLKPANIGFTSQGELKLFDFGYATKLRPKDCLPDGKYNLEVGIGTCRYMAPEVARCEPYNELADVYSFGILMWETIAIEKPFKDLKTNEWLQKVVIEGKRPQIDKHWTAQFQILLQSCWSEYIDERPSFDIIVDVLEEMILSHRKV